MANAGSNCCKPLLKTTEEGGGGEEEEQEETTARCTMKVAALEIIVNAAEAADLSELDGIFLSEGRTKNNTDNTDTFLSVFTSLLTVFGKDLT